MGVAEGVSPFQLWVAYGDWETVSNFSKLSISHFAVYAVKRQASCAICNAVNSLLISGKSRGRVRFIGHVDPQPIP